MAEQFKGNFYVKNGLLYHRDQVLGLNVEQLCVPIGRRDQVCKQAHDVGHQGFKKTKEKIRLNFFWRSMAKDIQQYTDSCLECQRKARLVVKDRIPISVIPRDEIPFSHLYMDCIGPLFDQAEFNYCLCIVDSATRWPFAFPLRAQTAKAVCDCLIQVFSLVGVCSVITSDQGSCFTSELTRMFLQRLGCAPRWSTPLHPEGNSLVERLNQSLKKLLHHVIGTLSNPRQWHKMLPYALWSIRESQNETLGVSPYMMVFGRIPCNSLTLLKQNWTEGNDLPVGVHKTTTDYMAELQQNLKVIHEYADSHAKRAQQKYVDHYNLRSRDKDFVVGQLVIVLLPDTNNKLLSRWQGPGTIVEIRSPHSYMVELPGGQRRLLHANKLRSYHVRVNEAIVNTCAIIYDKDEEFGVIPDFEATSDLLPSKRIDPVKLSHLDDCQRSEFVSILDEFSDCFSERPGLCKFGQHEIHVSADFRPKQLKPYKVPELLKSEVARQIQELLDMGFIRPSNSAMASPIVCVFKGTQGSGGVRICCDYKYVNKFTRGDAFPTPDINDVIHKVGSAKYVSVWDAKSGYWQIPMKPDHIWLTAFVTDFGLFEWLRMPFGLKCSSNSFIRSVQMILEPIRDFNNSYVDDMATCSNDWGLHLQHVRRFLMEIRKSGLTLNLSKCDFAKPEVSFVGHIIGSGRHGPDPAKVATVHDMKPPSTKKEVRQVLGFFSYFRTYIDGFADIARPLTELTKKHVPVQVPWSDVHQQAFELLKQRLCEATTLNTVEYGKPFGLLVDASNTAVGCCLIQWSSDGREKPIAFASSKLNSTQRAWATIEREAYAVVYALKKFRYYIFGVEIVVFSDHNPLTYLNDCAPKSAKLTRWALALQEFNLTFRFKAGRNNVAADCLSRLGGGSNELCH
jgi:hypothetical protein